jgi:hypothetical protein
VPTSPIGSMGLVLPTEGGDAGTYDEILNDALTVVSDHDHTSGLGARVPTAGLNINADLTFTSGGTPYAVKDAKAVDFSPVAASSMSAYAGAFFVNADDSNNLYFRTVAGSNVKVTNGAALNVGAFTGGFGGDYGSIPAEANFVDASKTYTFKSTAGGNWSRLQAGALRLTEFGTTETTYVELACPSALGGTYTITLPTGAPAANGTLLQATTAGVASWSNAGLAATTFASTVSVGSTLGVTGLITATAGVTAAAGQHFTVSTTGVYKHGTREKWFDGLVAKVTSGTPTLGAIHQYTGVSTLRWPIDLEVGKRITSIAWDFDRGGAGTVSYALKRNDGAAFQTVTSGSDSSSSGRNTVTGSSINHTLLTLNNYFIEITCGNAANVAYSVGILYDQP